MCEYSCKIDLYFTIKVMAHVSASAIRFLGLCLQREKTFECRLDSHAHEDGTKDARTEAWAVLPVLHRPDLIEGFLVSGVMSVRVSAGCVFTHSCIMHVIDQSP